MQPLPGFRAGVVFVPYRYVALILLIVQTSAVVLCMRFSRTTHSDDGKQYISSTAVTISELFKVVGSVGLLWLEDRQSSVAVILRTVNHDVFVDWRSTLMLAVPAVLYTIQNNLLFVALSNLSAATYQITYQLKILAAAVFSVIMLSRKLSRTKWVSLFLLMAGVAMVQMPDSDGAGQEPAVNINQFVGLVAVLSACCSSGFAGVYFEKILKGTRESVWIRNIQLGLFGTILGLIGVFLNDAAQVSEGGFFQGYNAMTWLVISLQAFGGLIIAAVIKYADNILKSFATSLSIIMTYVVSVLVGLESPQLSLSFAGGSLLVMGATFLYGMPDTHVVAKSQGVGGAIFIDGGVTSLLPK